MSGERVTCPSCNGSQRDLRPTAPGHRDRDMGPCFRCRGFGTVLAANLTDTDRENMRLREQRERRDAA